MRNAVTFTVILLLVILGAIVHLIPDAPCLGRDHQHEVSGVLRDVHVIRQTETLYNGQPETRHHTLLIRIWHPQERRLRDYQWTLAYEDCLRLSTRLEQGSNLVFNPHDPFSLRIQRTDHLHPRMAVRTDG